MSHCITGKYRKKETHERSKDILLLLVMLSERDNSVVSVEVVSTIGDILILRIN